MEIKIFLVILVTGIFFTISMNFVYGDSDLVIELKNVYKHPKVSKLELDGTSSMQLCPSDKCEIVVNNSSFIPPSSDNNMTITHTINFNVKFNITDTNIGSKQKEYYEKFNESMKSCLVYDIIKDKGREIYFCSSVMDIIKRISDSKSWYYDSVGIYDAIKNTYTIKGDFKAILQNK